MKDKNSKKRYTLVVLLLLLVGISIGYAAIATTLNINGNTTIEKASWDIHFENLVKTTGSEVATVEASIDDTKTLIEYTVTLPKPGDFYEFTVDIVNNGTIDAMISEVLKQGLTTEQEKYISYTAAYSDGMALEEKDYLKSGESQNIRVRVKYRDDITSSDLPTENQALSLKFMVTYIQADESAKERTVAICRRATELHTEECTQTDTTYYCSGAGYTTTGSKGTTTITYGNLGEFGNLVSGDAFDCDVNRDGTYDSETERFYYVTNLDTDSSYGVLVYYNNVAGGVSSNTIKFAYNTKFSYTEYYGPQTAMLQLPTTSQWKNVSLRETIRSIKDETGVVRIKQYSYDGYATRLLTTQEVGFACNFNIKYDNDAFCRIGALDNCNYLLENTSYSSNNYPAGYWLENHSSRESYRPWSLNHGRCVQSAAYSDNDNAFGVRPVIEVPISRIGY